MAPYVRPMRSYSAPELIDEPYQREASAQPCKRRLTRRAGLILALRADAANACPTTGAD